MPKPGPRYPDDARELVARRYRNQRRNWLGGEGRWPLEISLGCPTEDAAMEVAAELPGWVEAWREWRGPGSVTWMERHWRSLGRQTVPDRLVIAGASEAAEIAGEEAVWRVASLHYGRLHDRWPALAVRLTRWFETLADLDPVEADILEALLRWLEQNPRSGRFPRQVPVAGMDTKWIERRLPLVSDLLLGLRGEDCAGREGLAVCGLRQGPNPIRLRILDASLRRAVGGLGDITAPLDDLRALDLSARRVYIVENVQTGLAFEDEPGAVVFLGLGYGVTALAGMPWIGDADCIYWGDIDTHGFAILSRARGCLPRVRSILMDEATLLRYRALWVREPEQCPATDLPELTETERDTYRGLKEQRWGMNVRLEQERIPWDEARSSM